MIKSFSDLEVYALSHDLAMDIFKLSKNFPAEEKYSLTSQIVRSSRSVCANIAEGFGRKVYLPEFKKHLIYSAGSLEETKAWINFAVDCSYIDKSEFDQLRLRRMKSEQNCSNYTTIGNNPYASELRTQTSD